MIRTAKGGRGDAASGGRNDTVDDIESEFLGLWLDIARLREKVLALAARLKGSASTVHTF